MKKAKAHAAKAHMSKPSTAPMPHGHDKYMVQEAVHHLKKAAEIKADPKLHAAAKAHAKHEADALRKVAGRNTSSK